MAVCGGWRTVSRETEMLWKELSLVLPAVVPETLGKKMETMVHLYTPVDFLLGVPAKCHCYAPKSYRAMYNVHVCV